MTPSQRERADQIFEAYHLDPQVGTITATNGWTSGGDHDEPNRVTRTVFVQLADSNGYDTVRAAFAVNFVDEKSTEVTYAQLEGIDGANPCRIPEINQEQQT